MHNTLINHDIMINIHYNYEIIFKTVCENGHFEIAKWLYKTYIRESYKKIDIHVSCEINISEDNDYIFKNSCKNGHIDVAKWLCSLVDIYSIELDYREKIIYKIYDLVSVKND